jgi:hypothetical protein
MPWSTTRAVCGGPRGYRHPIVEISATHARRTSRYVLAVAAVAVALALVGGFLFVANRGSHRVVPKQSFNSTGTVSGDVRCGVDACDFLTATGSDGSLWQWSVLKGTPLPSEWQGKTVQGTVTIASDWGDSSTFTSDGQSVPVFGGKEDPSVGHSFLAGL